MKYRLLLFTAKLTAVLLAILAVGLLLAALTRDPSTPRSEAAVGLLLAYVVRGTA